MAEQIDLTKLEHVPYKNTLGVLNEYVMNQLDFINKFGHFNENKLYQLEVVLDEIESKLLLLEQKLDSVPQELFSSIPQQQAQQQQQPLQQQQQQQQQQQSQQDYPQQQQANDYNTPTIKEDDEEQAPPPPPPEPEMDENLKKYIKMYNLGVPLPAIKLKMQNEGYDPGLLDQHI